jgi:hypothetical protein
LRDVQGFFSIDPSLTLFRCRDDDEKGRLSLDSGNGLGRIDEAAENFSVLSALSKKGKPPTSQSLNLFNRSTNTCGKLTRPLRSKPTYWKATSSQSLLSGPRRKHLHDDDQYRVRDHHGMLLSPYFPSQLANTFPGHNCSRALP